MNITKLNFISIDRIIAHEIQAKTPFQDAYSIPLDDILNFKKEEKDILLRRLQDALANTSKTFQLDYEDKSDDSIFNLLKKIVDVDDKEFVNTSKSLAENLADAHFRTRIPGGYCLIGNGKTADWMY